MNEIDLIDVLQDESPVEDEEPVEQEQPEEPIPETDNQDNQNTVHDDLETISNQIENLINSPSQQTIVYEVSVPDSSGTYQWTYKGYTSVAKSYGSVAYSEYYNAEDGSFVQASNGDLVESDKINLFEEFLYYSSGVVHQSGVRTFDSVPQDDNLKHYFTAASDGVIVHIDELSIYEAYIENQDAEKTAQEKAEEFYEKSYEYYASNNENLLFLIAVDSDNRENLSVILESSRQLESDNEVLGQNLQVMYETMESINSEMKYLTYSTTAIGFLLALSAGIAIAKLVMERFK